MRKEKTPLQQWAWERFRTKGTIAAIINTLCQLSKLKNLTSIERLRIDQAVDRLRRIQDGWKHAHELSRRRAQ